MDYNRVSRIYHTTASFCYGTGELYQVCMPPNILPKSMDIPIRYHLSSLAGAAAINHIAFIMSSMIPGERNSPARSIGSSAVVATSLIAFETVQSQSPMRDFDYIDTGLGLSAIFISAVLLKNKDAKSFRPSGGSKHKHQSRKPSKDFI